jgi:hypothetical protein
MKCLKVNLSHEFISIELITPWVRQRKASSNQRFNVELTSFLIESFQHQFEKKKKIPGSGRGSGGSIT